jgi:hypothetical protein
MTNRDPNGEHWTLGTLRLFLEAIINTLKETVTSLSTRCDDRFTAIDKTVKAAVDSADRATSKAEAAAKDKFESVNEFRKAFGDRERDMMPRLETENLMKALSQRVDNLENAKQSEVGRGSGIKESWALIAVLIAVLANVVISMYYATHWSAK